MHCVMRAKSSVVALWAMSFSIIGSINWRASISSAGLVGTATSFVKRSGTIMFKTFLFGIELILPMAATDAPSANQDLVTRGAYLARAGDCVACHTASGGKPFAGGLPMQTPMGRIYSTNITPDPDTGIGRWSEQDFERALRSGVSKDGHNLYPAMPYPSYAKISDDDVAALYAYFMHGVTPVHEANRAPAIPFPLNMRWPLKLWNLVFPGQTRFHPRPDKDAQWDRGAYLVQGLGHCGACHTPRVTVRTVKATHRCSPHLPAIRT
jgi:alcohol dehydrogenase (quinone), cytochrome c subunit